MAGGKKESNNKVDKANNKDAGKSEEEGEQGAEMTEEQRKKERKTVMMKKAVRVLTVIVYMMGVSGGGFLLSLYYIIFWDPQIEVPMPPQYAAQVHASGRMSKRDLFYVTQDNFQDFPSLEGLRREVLDPDTFLPPRDYDRRRQDVLSRRPADDNLQNELADKIRLRTLPLHSSDQPIRALGHDQDLRSTHPRMKEHLESGQRSLRQGDQVSGRTEFSEDRSSKFYKNKLGSGDLNSEDTTDSPLHSSKKLDPEIYQSEEEPHKISTPKEMAGGRSSSASDELHSTKTRQNSAKIISSSSKFTEPSPVIA